MESEAPRKGSQVAGAEEIGFRKDKKSKWEEASRTSLERAPLHPRDEEDEDEAEETTPTKPDVLH